MTLLNTGYKELSNTALQHGPLGDHRKTASRARCTQSLSLSSPAHTDGLKVLDPAVLSPRLPDRRRDAFIWLPTVRTLTVLLDVQHSPGLVLSVALSMPRPRFLSLPEELYSRTPDPFWGPFPTDCVPSPPVLSTTPMIVATSNPFAVLDGMSSPRRLVCPAYSYPTRQPLSSCLPASSPSTASSCLK